MYMGLKYAFFAKGTYADNAEPTYSDGAEIGRAMAGNMSMTYDTAKGFGNGRQIEGASGPTGGTINYTVDYLNDAHKKLVLGWKEGADGVLSQTDANPVDGGFSFFRVVSHNNKVEYECWHILRTCLKLAAQDMQQREESTQFSGCPLEGDIYGVQTSEDTMEFRRCHTAATESAAIAWCKSVLSIT